MNRSIWVVIILVILALLGLAAYTQRDTIKTMLGDNFAATIPTPPSQSTPLPVASITEASPEASVVDMSKLTITLAEQDDSAQSGTATITEENGKAVVTLSLTGGSFTAPQPAHIHTGACPVPGAVKYPLTSVVNGKSTTTISTDIKTLLTLLPLAVNVHKSAAEVTKYTACGDIKNPS